MLWSCLSRSSFIHIYSTECFGYDDAFAAGTLFFQSMLASVVYVYAIRFKMSSKQMFLLCYFLFICIGTRFFRKHKTNAVDYWHRKSFSFGVFRVTNWYYTTDHDRKIQVSAAAIASLYGLFCFIPTYQPSTERL